MRKLKRVKLVKEFIEERIAKNQRRIQAISEENFKLRKQLEAIQLIPKQVPLTKADLEAREAEVFAELPKAEDQLLGEVVDKCLSVIEAIEAKEITKQAEVSEANAKAIALDKAIDEAIDAADKEEASDAIHS